MQINEKEKRELELLDKIIVEKQTEINKLQEYVKEIKDIELSFSEEKGGNYFFEARHRLIKWVLKIIEEDIEKRITGLYITKKYYKNFKRYLNKEDK